MKRIGFALIVGLLYVTHAEAAATEKQVVGSCFTSSSQSCTITPGVSITSTDALLVVAGGIASNNSLASVTATGHTVTVLDAGFSGAGFGWIGSAYECSATSGTPTFTVTITNSAGGSNWGAIIYEIQGNATTSCIDGHTGQTQASPGTGANGITSGTITVSTNGEFFVGGEVNACCTAATISLGTTVAWTNLQTVYTGTDSVFKTEEFAQATAASLAATFTQSSNQKQSSLIISMTPSGGAPSRGLFLTTPMTGLGVGGSFFRDPLASPMALIGSAFAAVIVGIGIGFGMHQGARLSAKASDWIARAKWPEIRIGRPELPPAQEPDRIVVDVREREHVG